MPSYNIKCSNAECDNYHSTTEIKKKMMEDYPPCQKCNSPTQAVFQQSGFVLLGKGWCGKTKRR